MSHRVPGGRARRLPWSVRAGAIGSGLSGRWLVLLAALIAFAGQSIVTQSHVHFDRGPVFHAPSTPEFHAPPQGHRRAPADDPFNCPICRDRAQAGHYLVPVAIVLVLPDIILVWRYVRPLAMWRVRSRSRAWRSRDPPALPQA